MIVQDQDWGGGGRLVQGDLKKRAGGHWSYVEKQNHINYLELMTSFLNLKCFCSTKENCHIKLCQDISVAVSYLQNMGGGDTNCSCISTLNLALV